MARTAVLPAESRRPGPAVTGEALGLASRMPRLLLEARQVAASLAHGIHGRRRAGPGESFWQFRPFVAGEAASRIDWRRSGRDDRLYVREREWESAQTVWLWFDRSASMLFRSSLARASKIDRALVLGLALADTLVDGGERVGLLGRGRPISARSVAETLAGTLAADTRDADDDLPPGTALPRQDETVILSDFLSDPAAIAARVEAISARGARGHLVLVADPVEETFPFEGQAVLREGEGGTALRIGDAAAWGRSYRSRLAAHRDALGALVRRRGWTLTVGHTDRPASEAALRALTLLASARAGGTER